jgi:nicotinamide riboside transporter PnuC
MDGCMSTWWVSKDRCMAGTTGVVYHYLYVSVYMSLQFT